MGKGRRNQRNPDYFKLQGGAVEERDLARKSKQALTSQKTGQKRVARASTKRASPTVKPAVTKVTKPAARPIPEAAYPTPSPRGLLRHVMDDTLGIARWVSGQIFDLLRRQRRQPSSV